MNEWMNEWMISDTTGLVNITVNHNYQLPGRTTAVNDKNFIVRMLYKDIWLTLFYLFLLVHLSAAVCHFITILLIDWLIELDTHPHSWDITHTHGCLQIQPNKFPGDFQGIFKNQQDFTLIKPPKYYNMGYKHMHFQSCNQIRFNDWHIIIS